MEFINAVKFVYSYVMLFHQDLMRNILYLVCLIAIGKGKISEQDSFIFDVQASVTYKAMTNHYFKVQHFLLEKSTLVYRKIRQ